jgi:hypothetical protein
MCYLWKVALCFTYLSVYLSNSLNFSFNAMSLVDYDQNFVAILVENPKLVAIFAEMKTAK